MSTTINLNKVLNFLRRYVLIFLIVTSFFTYIFILIQPRYEFKEALQSVKVILNSDILLSAKLASDYASIAIEAAELKQADNLRQLNSLSSYAYHLNLKNFIEKIINEEFFYGFIRSKYPGFLAFQITNAKSDKFIGLRFRFNPNFKYIDEDNFTEFYDYFFSELNNMYKQDITKLSLEFNKLLLALFSRLHSYDNMQNNSNNGIFLSEDKVKIDRSPQLLSNEESIGLYAPIKDLIERATFLKKISIDAFSDSNIFNYEVSSGKFIARANFYKTLPFIGFTLGLLLSLLISSILYIFNKDNS